MKTTLSNQRVKCVKASPLNVNAKFCYYEKDVKEFIEKIIYEDLNACRVCGDSHGDWFRIGTFIKKIKKRAGDKLTEEQKGKVLKKGKGLGRSYGY